jgi:hypothetical protein
MAGMSEDPETNRRGLLRWASWAARVISLPFGITYGDDDDLRKIADWLPMWALFVAIPLAVAAALAAGFLLARFF